MHTSKDRRLPGIAAIMVAALFAAGTAAPAFADGHGPDNSALHGTYSVRSLGYDDSATHPDSDASGAAGPGIPVSTSGVLVFDGNGHITSGDLFNAYGFDGATNGGQGCVAQLSATGTYTVNADGTVVVTLNTTLTNDAPGGVTDPCSQSVGSTGSAVLAGGVGPNGKQIDFTGLSPTEVVIDGVMTRASGKGSGDN